MVGTASLTPAFGSISDASLCLSFNERAWHAGISSWQGRERCNDYSIGIECEGTDELPYEAAVVVMPEPPGAPNCKIRAVYFRPRPDDDEIFSPVRA